MAKPTLKGTVSPLGMPKYNILKSTTNKGQESKKQSVYLKAKQLNKNDASKVKLRYGNVLDEPTIDLTNPITSAIESQELLETVDVTKSIEQTPENLGEKGTEIKIKARNYEMNI